jgi:RNA polymerase sigma factor (sigma-70 family)
VENEELVQLYRNGDKRALDKLIEQNKGIVFKIANKFYTEGTSSIDKGDLEQEGFIGLITAADRYDFNNPKKAQFITYAIHWVHQRIYSFVVGHSSREIGNNKFYNNCTSLNVPIGIDEDIELMETIEDDNNDYINIDEQIYIKQLRTDLESVMAKCNSLKEREILQFRYGWHTRQMTMNEIGDIYSITGERARQIHSIALRKLRQSVWARTNRNRFIRDRLIDDPYRKMYRPSW